MLAIYNFSTLCLHVLNFGNKFLYRLRATQNENSGWLIATDDFSGLSLGILVAFRFMVQYVIYMVLIGAVLACIGGTTYLW